MKLINPMSTIKEIIYVREGRPEEGGEDIYMILDSDKNVYTNVSDHVIKNVEQIITDNSGDAKYYITTDNSIYEIHRHENRRLKISDYFTSHKPKQYKMCLIDSIYYVWSDGEVYEIGECNSKHNCNYYENIIYRSPVKTKFHSCKHDLLWTSENSIDCIDRNDIIDAYVIHSDVYIKCGNRSNQSFCDFRFYKYVEMYDDDENSTFIGYDESRTEIGIIYIGKYKFLSTMFNVKFTFYQD
jgi:hypothetical protein